MNLLYSGVLYMKTILRKCEYCNIDFNARWHDVKKGYGRFCSQSCKQKSRKRNIFDRLWEKVDIKSENECWEYKEYRNECGYGVMSYIGKSKILAHRVAYMSKKGEIPEGLRILHSCDNPPCCNPHHLSAGTQSDNVKDMHSKGRAVFNNGEKHHKSKLKEQDVINIRNEYGVKDRHQLSLEYGVHHNTIMWIVDRKTWKHLP